MKKWAMALCATLLGGCASVDVQQYKEEKPQLNLREYFNGTLDGWGMFQSRSGEIKKRFQVTIEASWTGNTGVLDEAFVWSDGTTSRRVWTLTDIGDGRYTGRADDVVGKADGESAGSVLQWRYVMSLPVDDKVYHVNFDDWMVLIDDRVMLNRAEMSKFGFKLGEVTLAFRKR